MSNQPSPVKNLCIKRIVFRVVHSIHEFYLDCDVGVISGDIYENDQRFKVENVLYHAEKEEWGKNYWLSPEQADGEFILDLGCEDSYNEVELVNTHNGQANDRSTNRFKVFLR